VTATIPEIINSTYTGSGGTNFSITTTLVSSDVVAVVFSRGSTSTSSVTGLGGTWTSIFALTTSSDRVEAYYTTGVTGTGTVTVNRGLAETGGVSIYVIRGLNTFAVTEQHSTWDASSTSGNTDETTPSQSFGPDQVAILVGQAPSGSTVTFPSNPTPSGWTNDVHRTSSRRLFTAHLIGTSSVTAVASIQSTSATFLGIAMIVFGTPTGSTPLVSTFVGWGNPIF
jgi:hypothetical protein